MQALGIIVGPSHIMQNKRSRVALYGCMVAAFVLLAHATIPTKPPTIAELSTVWVGWANPIHYLRLDLFVDGSGLFCFYDRFTHRADLYAVTSWKLKGYDLTFALTPVDLDADPLTLKGTAAGGSLKLEVGDGRKHGYRAKCSLEEEQSIESVMRIAKQRMQVYRKGAEGK